MNFLGFEHPVNEVSGNPKLGEVFNGVSCCVAQYIEKFKTEVGLYVGHDKDNNYEYHYSVQYYNNEISIIYNKTEYSLNEFKELIDNSN